MQPLQFVRLLFSMLISVGSVYACFLGNRLRLLSEGAKLELINQSGQGHQRTLLKQHGE